MSGTGAGRHRDIRAPIAVPSVDRADHAGQNRALPDDRFRNRVRPSLRSALVTHARPAADRLHHAPGGPGAILRVRAVLRWLRQAELQGRRSCGFPSGARSCSGLDSARAVPRRWVPENSIPRLAEEPLRRSPGWQPEKRQSSIRLHRHAHRDPAVPLSERACLPVAFRSRTTIRSGRIDRGRPCRSRSLPDAGKKRQPHHKEPSVLRPEGSESRCVRSARNRCHGPAPR